MTAVASTDRWAWVTRVSLSVVVAAVVGLGAVIVWSDTDAPRHSLWRDPISWFAADEAPHPEPVRALMVVIGVGLVILSAAGWRARRPRSAVACAGLAGGLIVFLGFVPIECSMRIDFCEQLVRNRLVGGAHIAHGIAGLGLFVVGGVVVTINAMRRRTLPPALVAVVTIVAGMAIVVAPTNPRVGPLQWIVYLGTAIGLVGLWNDPVRRSSAAR